MPHDPTFKQSLALVCHRFVAQPDKPMELFYGGAAGGGKSDWLLMAALQYVDHPDYAAIIFRRTYQQLSKPGALIARSKQWLAPTDAHWSDQNKEWTFPTGAKLAFGYLEQEDDVEQYQSAEFQFIGFDELTHFSEDQYKYMLSRLRRLEGVKIPLRQCSASNPGSRGHAWVRDRLVEGKAPNRVFIPAKIDDNEYLDRPAYLKSLSHLSTTLQMQLREGVWNAFEGLAYPRFAKSVHVVPSFDVPAHWSRFEGLDHGRNHPAAWISFASDEDGNHIGHAGYYSPGLVPAHADAIKSLRLDVGEGQLYADPSIKARLGSKDWRGREVTTELAYTDCGISIIAAQNDRRAGYLALEQFLEPDAERYFPPWHPRAGEKGSPRVFFMDKLELEPWRAQFRDALLEDADSPASKFPWEAVDGKWEGEHGHAHAAARYALMSRPSPSAPVPYVPDDPRAALLQRVERQRDEASVSTRYEFT